MPSPSRFVPCTRPPLSLATGTPSCAALRVLQSPRTPSSPFPRPCSALSSRCRLPDQRHRSLHRQPKTKKESIQSGQKSLRGLAGAAVFRTKQTVEELWLWLKIRPTSRPTNRPTNQHHRLTSQLPNCSSDQSINRPIEGPINQLTNQPTHQPTKRKRRRRKKPDCAHVPRPEVLP